MQTFSLSFEHVPPVFKRGQHVVVGIFDEENRLYLSRKHIYPANIYRLFGGGANPKESPVDAAVREIKEETSLTTSPQLQETFVFKLKETSTKTNFKISFSLYYAFIHRDRVIPGDDVNGMRIFAKEDMPELIEEMKSMSPNLFTSKDNETFAWFDWGTVFVTLHEYVYTHWPKA